MNTEKLIAQIAAAYWGAKTAYMRQPNNPYTMDGITPYEIMIGGFKVGYDLCQLILTPLEKISDEDGICVAKMYGGIRLETHSDGFWQVVDKDNNVPQYFCVTNAKSLPAFLTDFLRSKHYDCGYGSIPSLIEVGIAVDATTLKDI